MKNIYTLLFLAAISLHSCNSISEDSFSISEYETGMTGTMRGVSVVNKKTVWISGSGGEFCMSSDAGETWTYGQVPGAENLDFRDVHGFSEQEAILMSAGPGEASKIYKTYDGGENWKLCFTNPDPKGFFDGFDFYDKKYGVMFSDPVDTHLNLLVTYDGGESWERFNPAKLPMIANGEYAFAASGTSIQFDPTKGIWIATGGSIARVWHADAINKEWDTYETPAIQGDQAAGLFSIDPRSSLRVVAVGGNYIQMDVSGANVIRQVRVGDIDWEVPDGAANVPFLECVKWISNYDLIACGPPGVWFSPDNGMSWSEIFSDGFHAMDVSIGGKIAWLAGNKGKVCKIVW
jgi:photosystem II stability/assembly factor-like uncharacterized protein